MADEISTKTQHELGDLGFAGLPAIISAAGKRASFRFIEFFTANIRNWNTRVSYGRAVREFCEWCEDRGFGLDTLNPVIVAGYIELLGKAVEKHGRGYSKPSVKQHLAAIRMHCVLSAGALSCGLKRSYRESSRASASLIVQTVASTVSRPSCSSAAMRLWPSITR